MIQNTPNPARGGAAGSGNTCLHGGKQIPVSTTPQKYQGPSSDRAVREARLELLREACMRRAGSSEFTPRSVRPLPKRVTTPACCTPSAG
jgi:hypothetical protein